MTTTTAVLLAVHPTAELFPLITGPEFESFVADIKANGQMDPIMLDQHGQVIDGRNRLRACERLGIEPRTDTYDGDDVDQYVVSHNLQRRHLTDSQRAMIAARLAQRKPGYRTAILEGQMGDITHLPLTIQEATDLLGVAESSVKKAKQVIRDGTESLQDLASEGGTPVTTAARVATELPPEEQDAYVAKVRAGADPVRAAPPDLQQRSRNPPKPRLAAPQPKRNGGNRRKHLEQFDALTAALFGAVTAFDGVTELDQSVTKEEATRLTGDLSKQIRSLNRINSLLKERT